MTTSDDDTIIITALAAITPEQWDQLHRLAHAVDPSDPGEWQGGQVMQRTAEGRPIIAMPFYMYSRQLNDLVETMYEYNFVVPFPWVAWNDRYGHKLDDMTPATTSTTDLVKYIVTVLRSDRFSEGYLGAEIRAGRFLDRLHAVIAHYRPATS